MSYTSTSSRFFLKKHLWSKGKWIAAPSHMYKRHQKKTKTEESDIYMDRERIRKLAAKLLDGTASPEEEKILHDWYDLHAPEKVMPVHTARSREELGRRIQSGLGIGGAFTAESYGHQRWSIMAASVVILVSMALGIYLFNRPSNVEWITVTVPVGESRQIQLPDLSTVWINAGSAIRHPKEFGKESRQVEMLDGQAFFEVREDHDRPFRVQTPYLNVSVLGTSFDIKAYSDEGQTSVGVRTGKVEVQLPDIGETKIIRPGKMAVVQNLGGSVEVMDREAEYIGTWKENRIVFFNEPVHLVLKTLERHYDVRIEATQAPWLDLPLTLKLDKQPLADVLEVMKYIFDFEYKIQSEGNRILIYKNG